MAVAGADKLFPAQLLRQSRVFKAGGTNLNLVDKTGLDAYNTAWDINTTRATKPVQTRKRLRLLSKTACSDKEIIRKNKSTASGRTKRTKTSLCLVVTQ